MLLLRRCFVGEASLHAWLPLGTCRGYVNCGAPPAQNITPLAGPGLFLIPPRLSMYDVRTYVRSTVAVDGL